MLLLDTLLRGLACPAAVFPADRVAKDSCTAPTTAVGQAKAEIEVHPCICLHMCVCRYGPRQSERKFGFSDRGRLVCEVNYVSLAQTARGKQAQVRSSNTGSSSSSSTDS